MRGCCGLTALSNFIGSETQTQQLPTYADNAELLALAGRTPLLQQSIDISCPSGSSKPAAAGLLLWVHAGRDTQTDRRTDGQTPGRYIDPAPHTAGNVSKHGEVH